jgi:hypothetical protein
MVHSLMMIGGCGTIDACASCCQARCRLCRILPLRAVYAGIRMLTFATFRPALILLAASACGSPPDAGHTRSIIHEHFAAVAPRAVVADSFDVVDVTVSGDRARFRTVWTFADTSGVWVDTSRVLTAQLEQQPNGWVLVGYDEPMTGHIVELIDEDRRRQYQDLLDAVHHVYHAILDAGWYYAQRIDEDALRERVAMGGHGAHATWGVTPPAPLVAQVIWLRDPADPNAACALPVTAGEGRPSGWEWVRDTGWFTCRGRGEDVYSRATLPDEVRAVIAKHGVMPAAPPVSSPAQPDSRHAH